MKEIKLKEAKERFKAKKNKEKENTHINKTNTWKRPEERTISTTALETIEIGDIRDLARQLGAIRYEFIKLIEKEKEKIEKQSKDDSTLIHSFEFNNLTKEEVWKMYQETQERRTNRRQNRYRYAIIKGILDGIKIRKPDQFVIQAINGCKNTRDFDKYIEQLMKDGDLFCK